MKETVILSGYYGFGNTGDEASCEAICSALEKNGFSVCVLRGNRRLPDLCHTKGCALVLGGGTLFQDLTGWQSCAYYAAMLLFAKKRHLKTALFANGLGPTKSKFARDMTRFALNATDYVSFRDKDSLSMAKCLTKNNRSFFLGADIALVPTHSPLAPRFEEPYMVVAPRKMSEKTEMIFLHGVCRLQMALGCRVFWLPFYPSKDFDVCRRLCLLSGGVLLTPEPPKKIASLLQGAKLCVGMRLHMAVLAQNTPALLIAPPGGDPKYFSYAKEAGQPSPLNASTLTPDKLVKTALQALSSPPDCLPLQKRARADLLRLQQFLKT